jgi:hypothetical protein
MSTNEKFLLKTRKYSNARDDSPTDNLVRAAEDILALSIKESTETMGKVHIRFEALQNYEAILQRSKTCSDGYDAIGMAKRFEEGVTNILQSKFSNLLDLPPVQQAQPIVQSTLNG